MKKTLQTIALLVAGLGMTTTVTASEMLELTTAQREVLGTREVESGDFALGIAKLERALGHANNKFSRSPALVNLCVAHAAAGDLERASDYCNAALETGVDAALAYNNRAVVNYMRGDMTACLQDLERAAELKRSHRVIQRNLERVRGKVVTTVASNQ